MTVINTNIASMNAQYSLNKVNKAMEDTMQQLSTGKRINSAADDAAGLSIGNTVAWHQHANPQRTRRYFIGANR
jgi:flagellin-like hook-associated protein FlgL